MFAASTGLASTGDDRLIRGILATVVVDEVLGHADKRKAAYEAIGAIAPLGASTRSSGYFHIPPPPQSPASIVPPRALLFPAYSPSLQAEADKKVADILRTDGDPDPAATLAHASIRLRDAGVVEPWPAPVSPDLWRYIVTMVIAPLVPSLERPIYTLGQKWIRNDGEYKLRRIDRDLYVFSAGPDQEVHLTKNLMVARAKMGGWVTEFESLPELWPLAVGKWGTGEGRWWVPNELMNLRIAYTWAIEALEEVSLPIGKFKAFRITFEWDPAVRDAGAISRFPTKRLTMWYAPGVQQLVKAAYSDPGPLNFHIIALEALSPSSPSQPAPTAYPSPPKGPSPSPSGSPPPEGK